MNALDILTYGHQTVLQAIDGVADEEWKQEGACGVWSMQDIIAHLASYEHLLEEILGCFLDGGPALYLTEFQQGPAPFNDAQVAARSGLSSREVVAEYTTAHQRTMDLMGQIPEETRRQSGTLPWYGEPYALDDLVVYMYYGHKREHSAQ